MRACHFPGCPTLVEGTARYCPRHAPRAAQIDRRDPRSKRIYNSAAWGTTRRQILEAEPICRECKKGPPPWEWAVDVDHIRPLRAELAAGRDGLDLENLAPICKKHHAIKTRRGD